MGVARAASSLLLFAIAAQGSLRTVSSRSRTPPASESAEPCPEWTSTLCDKPEPTTKPFDWHEELGKVQASSDSEKLLEQDEASFIPNAYTSLGYEDAAPGATLRAGAAKLDLHKAIGDRQLRKEVAGEMTAADRQAAKAASNLPHHAWQDDADLMAQHNREQESLDAEAADLEAHSAKHQSAQQKACLYECYEKFHLPLRSCSRRCPLPLAEARFAPETLPAGLEYH